MAKVTAPKTNHAVAYRIDGAAYSDLHALRAGGIIDVDYIVHGGGNYPPQQFINDAIAAGLTPGLNNGNDGIAGWDGTVAYVQKLKQMGLVVVGGESEQAAEIDAYMDNGIIFLDLGGEGTPGGYQDDIWRVTHPGKCHGAGAVSYFETYDSSTNFWDWSVIGQACLDAKAHGVSEIGILIGSWMQAQKVTKKTGDKLTVDHEAYFKAIASHSTPQNYLDLAAAIEAHGIRFAGFYIWGGYGFNMNSLYAQFKAWIDQFQAVWPPTDITMANRIGNSPVPTPTPNPVPAYTIVGTPAVATLTDGSHTVFVKGSTGALYACHCDTTGSWDKNWANLGGQIALNTSPAVVVMPNSVYVFTQGLDGQCWYRNTLSSGWSTWTHIPNGKMMAATNPVVTRESATQFTVYVIGTDSQVWRIHNTNGAWDASWEPI